MHNFVCAIAFNSKENAARLAETGFPATNSDFGRYLSIPEEDATKKRRTRRVSIALCGVCESV
ncbi:hypothetical protein FACS189475_10060 [Betaproteobacteria bacterium]|nr:hypothetical protein FACS189475_10060 [Betaproteobacteria bacterium]